LNRNNNPLCSPPSCSLQWHTVLVLILNSLHPYTLVYLFTGTPTPPISVRGNEPNHPFLGECVTRPPQSWPSSNGRSPNRGDPFQCPSTCIASVTFGTDWGVSPGHQICPSVFIDTLRVAHEEAPPGYPTTSPSRGAPSTFMEPLSRMIHSHLETPHTLSRLQGSSTFREPYPVANPPTAPAAFVHSPDP